MTSVAQSASVEAICGTSVGKLKVLHVISEQMVLQPFQQRADVLGVLQKPLRTEDGSLRDSKL